MNKYGVACLLLLAIFATGCPYNQYIVELTPRGRVIERKLVFYCEDGKDTNGVPNYQGFSPDELKAISVLYPRDGVKRDGLRYVATGEFAGPMPSDVGGAGSFTNYSTSLGSTALYAERFRGDDDMAGKMAKRLRAAEQLVDFVVGWSRMEFGREPHYKELRRFLNVDFRQDVRNLGLYSWMMEMPPIPGREESEEFAFRYGQYLVERGYLTVGDLPEIFHFAADNDARPVTCLIQRLVAAKLRIPASGPMPLSVAFLEDPDKAWKSWEEYLATTGEYRKRLRHWEMEKARYEAVRIGRAIGRFLHPRPNGALTPAAPPKPEPAEVANELIGELFEFGDGSPSDHLAVRLSLPSVPAYTNGKWDPAHKQVVWESELNGHGKQAVRLPAFCYANWSSPNEVFQMEHFGKVALSGDDLLQYCLWRGGLGEKQAGEWEALLAGLRPGKELKPQLDGFRFSDELTQPVQNTGKQASNAADFPRGLIEKALDATPDKSGK